MQCALPGLANAHSYLSTSTYNQRSDQWAFGASSDDQTHVPYEATSPSYGELDNRKVSGLPFYSPISERRTLDAQVPMYLDPPTETSGLQAPPEIGRKRKMTSESPSSLMPAKRLSPTQSVSKDSIDYGSHTYDSAGSTYSQDLRPIDLSYMQRRLTPYGRLQDPESVQDGQTSTSARSLHPGATDTNSLMRPPMSQAPSHSPSYATHQINRSPGLGSNAPFQLSTSSSLSTANPPLVRASTLQQPLGSASASTGTTSDVTFNPYGMYPNRAILKIRGDLNSMQDNWTSDERLAKRRLVRFRGEQSGSTINTYFKAVKPDERPSSSETREKRISCIHWEERDEYFVTSVDTIALLETLVGARFTVEEKNRIRRNLETHHPETISKSQPNKESFFKVIMGFPNPKPRNIEKDVKVFPWPILAQALRKVISKYVSLFAVINVE